MESTKKQYRQYLTNDLVRLKEAMHSLVELFSDNFTIPVKELKHSLTYYNAITTISLNMFEYVKDSGVSDGPEEVLRNLIKTSQDEHSKLLNWYISEDDSQVQEDLMKESLETAFIIYDYLRDLEEQLFSSILLITDTQAGTYEAGTGVFDIWNQRGKPWEDIEFKPQEPKKEPQQSELFENPDKEVADYDDSAFKRVEDKKDQDGDIPF